MKTNNGITLIALIITIISMIILAGVAISMTVGENGVLSRAEQAKLIQSQKSEQEKLELAVSATVTKGQGELTKDLLEETLEEEFGKGNFKLTSGSDGFIVAIGENSWKVEKNGKVTLGESNVKEEKTNLIDDLKIEVSKTKGKINSEILNIKTNVTFIEPDSLKEEEAVKIFVDSINDENNTNYEITTLEELLVMMIFDDLSYTYQDVLELVKNELGIENATEQEIFSLLMDDSEMTIQKFALQTYQETIGAKKKIKINGQEVTDKATWDGIDLTYAVLENDTYEIEYELDGNIATESIKITDIDNINNEIWIDNGNGTYSKGDVTIEKGEEILNAEIVAITGASGGKYIGTWSVLGVEDNNLKLVSTKDTDTVSLGRDDPRAKKALRIESGSLTDKEQLEVSMWSYKNAIETLNMAAQKSTGIKDARSIELKDIYDIVGEENVNKGEYYGINYNYYYNKNYDRVYLKHQTGVDDNNNPIWSYTSSTNYSKHIFLNEKEESIVVDSEEDEITLKNNAFGVWVLTDEKIKELGVLGTSQYWIADKIVNCSYNGGTNVEYGVRSIAYGTFYNTKLFESVSYCLPAYTLGCLGIGVRAIVFI